MKIYNTLSRSVEEFKPIRQGEVSLYSCGPTVYDFPHIGNLRTFIFTDLLIRSLELNDYKVKSVQNITDIDDKIIIKAKAENVSIDEVTKKYEKYFHEDIEKIGIKAKNVTPHATEYIDKMLVYIQKLLDKKLAYKEEDGSVYFDISEFKNYGKLSRIDFNQLKTGTRILSDEYDKENVQDFALWKAEEISEVGYNSPWGWGRPGWHLECSVMSQDNLGEIIDIHTGGVDLIFPHHENEIAQSEGATGKKFVNYFVHGAHMLVDGQKMSKSLNNFYRLKDIEEKGIDPMALRYLYLQTHYRQEMNFTWESLKAAETALNKLRKIYNSKTAGEIIIPSEFIDAINDDLNIPIALSVIWENIDDLNKSSLDKMDEVLGLNLKNYQEKELEVPESIIKLVETREEMRSKRDWDGADKLREEIMQKGYMVDDTPKGAKVKKL